VSVPSFRTKFLELYYGRYLRPLKDPLIGSIEMLLPLMVRIRPVYNVMVSTAFGKVLMRLIGLVALPKLPVMSLVREASRISAGIATADRIERLTAEERARAVVFVPDAFTEHFDPKAIAAGLALAGKLGFTPYLAAPLRNGKALHVLGYLGHFAKTAERSARYIDRLTDLGVTLVGIDPSMTLAYRSEYRDVPAAGLRAKVLLPQEWLCKNLGRLKAKAGSTDAKTFRLLAHCTERTNLPEAMKLWATAFEQLGIRLDTTGTGCCGMAGTFGHEARNRHISEKLYAMSWKPVIAGAACDEVLMATGYSCRSQIKAIDSIVVQHPLEVINGLVG
jgi:Fe-S oxidoreductase